MPEDAVSPGALVAHHHLAPLLDIHTLVTTSVITDDGPREWLECLDRLGCTRARLHLLPDTDFLAWDALTASCQPERHPPRACSWRPDRAAVMQFRLRELAGLALLEPGHSASLSPLSSGIAARIAQAESAVLLK
ncbi:hypothetical protein GCM10007863_13780 [Dyella mobilis]|nr:hypothetical protein GCM10007863_13780 [Dyella mobilis]